MIIAILAVLKAGGAYLPIDPEYPDERRSYIVGDSGVSHAISKADCIGTLADKLSSLILLDSDRESIASRSSRPPAVHAIPDNVAYCIYTSGSTGKPKGALLEHQQVVRLMVNDRIPFTFTAEDVWSMFHSYCFDFSVWEMYGALLYGGRLVIVSEGVSRDPQLFLDLVSSEQVTVLNQTPSAFMQLMHQALGQRMRNVSLRYIIFGGEALAPRQLQPWNRAYPDVKLVNMYGITETTVHVTVNALDTEALDTGASNIGIPIPTLQTYLVDSGLRLLPVGVPGELYVGGAGLARNYLKRPELTAERFIPHPFGPAGARLYKSGDLARYLPHGEMEYLGRLDHQVKIRGFRIELGEIESVLMQHRDVREAIVLAREDQTESKRLVAYLTTDAKSAPTISELRGFLKTRLADYMVPASFVMLEKFPLTPNGKVDRRALPVPDQIRPDLEDAFVAARSPVERRLAEIWCQVLGLERVGVHDNFFELGGHSLLATKVVSRIRAVVGTELPLRRIFESPTVSELAKILGEEEARSSGTPAAALPPLERTRHEGPVPLSFAQQRLWFLDQMEPGNPYYNMPAALQVSGAVQVAALEQAFGEIVRRHEVLQAGYLLQHGRPMQVRMPDIRLAVRIVDRRSLDEAARETLVRGMAALDARRPFDLSAGQVMRVTLLTDGATSHTILFAMHHIVSDGWSLAIVVRELSVLFAAFSDGRPSPLDELPVQYADFAVWQRKWLESDGLKSQLAYWKVRLGGHLPTLDIRTDRPRPEIETFGGADEILLIPQPLARALNRLSAQEHVTLFMTLLAAYKTLLYRHVGEDDVVVGTDLAGRNRAELEGLIGFFVNLVVLRTDLSGNPAFRDVLARVRETAMDALGHQDVPFDRLVEELRPQRHRSRTPLFQMLFVMENVPLETLRLPGLTMTPMPSQAETARFDLALFVREQDDGIVTKWTYKTDLFDRATIHRLANQHLTLLEHIAAAPDTRVNDLALQTEAALRDQAVEESRRREARMSSLVPGRRRASKLPEHSEHGTQEAN
jgi:amino acid adenylation domain-containing protein